MHNVFADIIKQVIDMAVASARQIPGLDLKNISRENSKINRPSLDIVKPILSFLDSARRRSSSEVGKKNSFHEIRGSITDNQKLDTRDLLYPHAYQSGILLDRKNRLFNQQRQNTESPYRKEGTSTVDWI